MPTERTARASASASVSPSAAPVDRGPAMPAPLLYYYVLHGLELPGTLTERKDGYTEAPNSQAGAAALPTTLVQAPAMPAALVYYHVLNGLALPASCESTASLTGAHLPANEAWEQTYTFDNPLYWECT